MLLLVIATGTMAGIRRCSSHRLAGINPADTIVVAIQYAPLSFYMHDDTLGGFDYDLMRMIARHNNVKFKFVPVTTARDGLRGLKAGRFDMLAADFPLTAGMRDSFLFTEPAYLDKQVLVQLRDSIGATPAVTSALGLRGDSVWITAGSPIRSRIEHLADELGDTIYIHESPSTPEQLMILTALGKIPRAVINEQTAKSMLDDYPLIDISTAVSFSQFQPWVIARDNSRLLQRMDLWLNEVKATAAYDSLLSRYIRL